MNIAKKVKFENAGYGWLVIEEENVGYKHCNGEMPYAYDVLCLMLADKDVRQLIRDYAQSKRKKVYYIDCKEGMSECMDFYIIFPEFFGGEWHIVKRKKLMHVSCFTKINEEIPLMYIGDFVEMIAYIHKRYGGFEQMARKVLFRHSKAKYVYERKPQLQSYTKTVTHLFD